MTIMNLIMDMRVRITKKTHIMRCRNLSYPLKSKELFIDDLPETSAIYLFSELGYLIDKYVI